MGAIETFSEREVKEQFETNFFGLFKVTKSMLPYMRGQKPASPAGRSGLIINVSSISGLFTTAYYGIYSASKYAVEAITQALRIEESLYGIKVVSVNPGSFETKFWENEKFPKNTRSSLGKFNERIKAFISRNKRRRGNSMVVAKKIREIIETKNPKKNYLIGWDVIALYLCLVYFLNQLLTGQSKRL
ncbi:hypothetical protein A3D00_00455 [Candidatus Woesebacteria bacterium RIFCSPHIGHO2_02_FULL_38_9]|uniref:Uncharacterized protein n=1 Tax=Candidatus Woesebacteria bacterium RIFCSPHIGHO2_01_FULL_39_28 TaxID=1802496 RepID=A0A1F7YKB4_9BACT|nr:MAG: hypothetical protein A2627_04705 [Candidatus Woesebacteria bacterium RIFCSPHIGHO2_01_FULL_39_28]OGM33202.1 MAG: hypothetical protein A3D00_00455 [Candidatus Woesebacteria bacterium RIFCSPHIGHO2_02_FULL_38_9]OGM57091.1 MAG: hypothetical protein A3A50_05510 [Candidatus Woesebacteria bacterium RIFCSPLOWO2_01_FULL_38_20]